MTDKEMEDTVSAFRNSVDDTISFHFRKYKHPGLGYIRISLKNIIIHCFNVIAYHIIIITIITLHNFIPLIEF